MGLFRRPAAATIQYIVIGGILGAAGCNGASHVAPPIAGQQSDSVPRAGATQRSRAATSSFTSLYSFAGGTDGSNPQAGLISLNGVLYGTTASGGSAGGYGTVFSVTPSAQEEVLYRFGGPPNDGAFPSAELLSFNDALYGTTRGGGSGYCQFSNVSGCGTVFSVATSGQEEYLYSFRGGSLDDGEFPYAGVTARNGALFGTTQSGGSFGDGMVFAITVYGVEGSLYNFRGSPYDGAHPQAGLVLVGYGEFYGTTQLGGSARKKCRTLRGCGMVFMITPAGREGILYNFKGGHQAKGPIGSVVSVKGRLYGTTAFGGAGHNGTIFSVTTTGHERVLHSFQGGADGSNPAAGLIDVNGMLYGTTSAGGGSANCSGGCGTIFSVTTSGKERVLHSFSGMDGASPVGRLVAVGTVLYGTTSAGGASNLGTVFELSLK
jgi:uncharacterized repeat protein (TIGR03803 family)